MSFFQKFKGTVIDQNGVETLFCAPAEQNGIGMSWELLEAEGVTASTRALLIDGYLYLFSNGVDQIFSVTAVGK